MAGTRRIFMAEHPAVTAIGTAVPPRDAWVLYLQTAIVMEAANDLRIAMQTHDEGMAAALQRWFLSEWGQLLSFGQGGAIIRRIKKEEDEREQNEA